MTTGPDHPVEKRCHGDLPICDADSAAAAIDAVSRDRPDREVTEAEFGSTLGRSYTVGYPKVIPKSLA